MALSCAVCAFAIDGTQRATRTSAMDFTLQAWRGNDRGVTDFRMRRSRKGWAVIGSLVASAIIASAGCAFSSGRLVIPDDDASTGATSKHFGAFGSDARFTWTPSEVVDGDREL